MIPVNLGEGDYDTRFDEAFEWVAAIDAYDHNCKEPLTKLLETCEVPSELLPIIEKINAGERKPNLKAASKLKIAAKERMQIAAYISTILGLIDGFKYGRDFYLGLDEFGNELPRGKIIDQAADRRGAEPIQVIRSLDDKKKRVLKLSARKLGVSEETIENLLRDLRDKMKKYPNV